MKPNLKRQELITVIKNCTTQDELDQLIATHCMDFFNVKNGDPELMNYLKSQRRKIIGNE